MKFVDEFRDPHKARALFGHIERLLEQIRRPLQIMEFCGGHTHTIFRYGLEQLLPASLELVHGPGCPVCVLPRERVDVALELATQPGVIFTSFGDALRIPGSTQTLQQAKAAGADIRTVYSPLDALALARRYPKRQVIFFALGFETTMPATALTLLQAEREGMSNFSLLCHHVTTPPILRRLLQDPSLNLDGFIAPGHVSMVIGAQAFDFVARDHSKPMVIAGFEPLDLLQALWMLLRQIAQARATVENQYTRVVTSQGNVAAVAAVRRVFQCSATATSTDAGVRLREPYAAFDAERRFGITAPGVTDLLGGPCGEVLRGALHPRACAAFGTLCTPQHPLGASMVSAEGACAACYTHDPGRQR